MKKKIVITIIFIFAFCLIGLKTLDTQADNMKYTYYIENLPAVVERTNNYKVRGWVMSDYENKEVKIYIDDKELEIEKEARPDVYEAIKGYGTEEQNPMPGYLGYIDTTKLSVGKHTYKLEILDSNTQNVLATQTRTFEIVSYKYTSWIEKLSEPVGKSTNFKIRGWVMANTSNKEVKAYVDDEEVEIEEEARPDVISAIKGYGTKEQNPMPGYVGYMDTTKLSEGKHEFKLVITDTITGETIGEITKSFEVEGYKYNYYMEKINTLVERSQNFKIRGWVMTNTSEKTVKIYIDNQEVAIEAEARPDVIAAISGYGGEELNPTPGYIGYIDTTKLAPGNHEFKLVITDNISKEVIGEEKKTFQVEDYKYTYYMENISTTVPKTTKYKIRGWVMANTPDKTTKVYIDNKEVAVEAEARPDVIAAITGYGGEELNPVPGYIGYIDTTKLTSGTHEFKIVTTDSNGNIVGQATKKFKVEELRFTSKIENLDNTLERTTSYQIKGWQLANVKDRIVRAFIDGDEVEVVTTERQDIPGKDKEDYDESLNPTPGFVVTIDTEALTSGTHEFMIVITDTSSGEVIGSENKNFKVANYESTSWIERPKENNKLKSIIDIRGWVMTNVSSSQTKVYIDNEEIITDKETRPDVIEVHGDKYGDETINPTPGYKTSYSTENISDGTHTLTVITTNSKTNEVIRKDTVSFTVKKYDGTMHLENFSNSMFTKEIVVRGWKMTDAPDSYVKVYIDVTDMEKLGATITTEERPDVIEAYGEQFGVENNKVPGFNINVDLSQVGQGVHTLRFVVYSNKDEEICNYTKQIMIYKGLTLGIDVSQHNGTINWSNVKKDSIDFAFIRLGYRGWGTGLNTTDSQYKTNINNAYNAGINVGVYFFSQAINEREGREEADYVIDTLMSNGLTQKVTLPIAIDTEMSTGNGAGRADNISVADRTAAMKGFADRIKERGYTPMIYASPSWLMNDLDLSQLSDVKIWLAHWTNDIDKRSDYTGVYETWQYTSKGSVSGISGLVDRNVSFAMY